MRLLLAEDDTLLSESLARALRERSYAVDVVGDGTQALRLARRTAYDALVLDVMLPERDGFDVARAIRADGRTTPILMLTARDAVRDRVTGLDAGADDYLTKPFDLDELCARLRALARRGHVLLPACIMVGDLTVDTRAQTAQRDGRELMLTAKEYALLELLARNAGAIVPRAEICAHVWDDNHDPLSNAIEVCMARLRRKVDVYGEAPLIHTRRGAGYMLAAPEARPAPESP